jgi:hypothetical protein
VLQLLIVSVLYYTEMTLTYVLFISSFSVLLLVDTELFLLTELQKTLCEVNFIVAELI